MGTRIIRLPGGGMVLVDQEDFDMALGYKWHRHKGRYTSYARANAPMINGKKENSIYLHRKIMNAPAGTEVDHINGDGLDCRRSNMRILSRMGNALNSRVPKNSTTGIKGVTWSKNAGKWMAKIKLNRRQTYLGYFTSMKKAHEAVERARAVAIDQNVTP